MALRHIIISLLLFCSSTTLAQLVLVKGNVSAGKSNIKLSGVTVRVGTQSTQTNNDGYFEFIASLKTLTENGINFSHIGYLNTRLIYQPNRFYEVGLLENNTTLKEVVVGIKGEDIIKKAIKKIPENYPNKPISIKGILRVQKWRNHSEYFKSDAIISAYIPSYTSKEKTTVAVLQNRIDTITDKSLNYIRHLSSYNIVQFQDIAHNNYIIAKIIKKKKYDYVLTGKQNYNGHRVFVVNTTVRDTTKVYDKIEATFYIDTVTYAFVASNIYTYNLVRVGLLTLNILNYRTAYEKIGEKWYLKELHNFAEAKFNQQRPKSIVDFVRTEIDSINPQKIPYKAIVQAGDNTLLIDIPGNDDEWAKYENLFKKAESDGKMELLPGSLMDTIKQNSIIASQNYKKPLSRKVYDYIFGNNIRSSFSIVKFPISINSSLHSTPDIATYGLDFGSNYRLYKSFFIGFQLQTNIPNKEKIGLSALGLNLSNEFIFNKNARNIILTPYIGSSITTIKIKSDKVAYNILDCGLRVSYELTRKKALFVKSSFNSAFGSKKINEITFTPSPTALGIGIIIKN